MHFGYTIVYVPDVQAASTFYESAFGCKLRFISNEGDYAEMETGDTTLSFASEKMAGLLGFTITPNRAEATAPAIELAFVTEEVLAGFEKAVAAGAAPVTNPKQTPWGQMVSYVRDLNGVLVEICSPTGG